MTDLDETITAYARAVAHKTDLEADDLLQEMRLAVLQRQAARPAQKVNDAYEKRCAWFARSAALRHSYKHQQRVAPLLDETGEELPLYDPNPTPEESLLEAERLAALQELLPKIQAVIRSLTPANQRIVSLILLDLAGPGELPRASGLSPSAISHRKRQIRRAFEAAGLTRERLPL